MSTRNDTQGKRILGLPKWIVVTVPLVAVVVAACFSVTVISSDGSSSSGPQKFDAAAYGKAAYAKTVVPYVEAHALDLVALAARLADDQTATEKSLGHNSGQGSPFSFPVSTTGVAGKVDNGLLPLTVASLPPTYTVYVQVGPAINGTALRDVSGKITFSDFADQIGYQDAALAINNQVKLQVLATVDASSLDGKTVSVVGAFQEGVNPGFIAIVPTSLKVGP